MAVVNTELVTSVELQQRLDRIQADAQREGARLPDAAALRQQVLDALIDERVQITHARDSGQRVDEGDIDRAIANIAAQNQLTIAQLRDRLREWIEKRFRPDYDLNLVGNYGKDAHISGPTGESIDAEIKAAHAARKTKRSKK